jgi:transposase
MRKTYPSDISREQFELIRPQLESFRKRTKPKTVNLYNVFCGILYILSSGCQWRMLPGDFPKWRTVHEYFRLWSQAPLNGTSLFDRLLKELVIAERSKSGRDEEPSCVIIDSQSVKNTDTATQKGYDAGKKESGIKRHLAVDTLGLPHAIHISTANVTDRNGALEAFLSPAASLTALSHVIADGGYTGKHFALKVQEIVNSSVTIVKRSEPSQFVVLPKRWIVERSFAWLEKCRRLWKNCERKLETSGQMVVLAFLSLLLKRSPTNF